MRLAHKRNVQKKLRKRMITLSSKFVKSEQTSQVKTQIAESSQTVTNKAIHVNLTPKQQQVFDIVGKYADGVNPKSIGLDAGQEDSKAASWATGALKKLLEENLVEKIQLSGNKVIYKSL